MKFDQPTNPSLFTGTVTSVGSGTGLSGGPITTSGTLTANLSTGISGGQSAIGGTGANENLTLNSTVSSTKGSLIGLAGTFYLGNGITNASPTSANISGTGGLGTDIQGGTLTMFGGAGTGTGAGGNFAINVAYPSLISSSSQNGTTGVFSLLGSNIQSSSTIALTSVTPTVHQSGTAGYTGFLLNVTETTTGSGSKLIQDWQIGGSSKVVVTNQGRVGVGLSAPTYLVDVFGVTTTGTIVFAGAGTNDLSKSGTFTGDRPHTYQVVVTNTGTPGVYRWTKDGTSIATGIVPSGAPQALDEGISVTIPAGTAHTAGDTWTFTTTVTGQINTNETYYQNSVLALVVDTNGNNNIGIGNFAGNLMDTASVSGNINIGANSGGGQYGGSNNISIGGIAGYQFTANDNIAIGSSAAINATSSARNVIIGSNSAQNLGTGDHHVAVGYGAGVGSNNDDNVSVGYIAGASIGTGKQNTFVGSNTGAAIGAGDNNTAVGYTANFLSATTTGAIALGAGAVADNGQIVIGSSIASITNMYIGNDVANASAATITISSTGGLGTDKNGGNFNILGGRGTGTGQGGSVILQVAYPSTVSGSSQNSQSPAFFVSSQNTASSGSQNLITAQPTINQSGTAGYTGFLVNVTETATGSGTKNIFDLQVGNSSKLSVGNGGYLITTSGRRTALRVVVAAGAVTVATTDYVIVVNKTVGAATVVNLPAAPSAGDTYIIKDGKGDANANNITITPAAGNIDGAGTYVMNINYQSITVVYNGTQWNVI